MVFSDGTFLSVLLDEPGIFGYIPTLIMAGAEVCLLTLVCLFVYVLNHSFTSNALESMSLRAGRKSELAAIVTRNLMLAAPDIALTMMAFQRNSSSADANLMLRSILHCGWICLLLIPGLVASKHMVSIPTSVILRDILSLSMGVSAWTLILPWMGISYWSCFILSLIYIMYIVSAWRTTWIAQEQRDLQRETRLMTKLELITNNTVDSEGGIETLPIRLVGPSEITHTVVTLDIPKYQPLDDVRSQSQRNSLIEQALSLICIRAVPGTATERLYMVSLVNAFVIEMVLSVSAVLLSENLFERIATTQITRLYGPMILALLSKAPHLIPALSRETHHQLILDSWGSHIVGLTIGSSIPWVFGLTMNWVNMRNFSVGTVDIICSAIAMCVLNILVAVSIFRKEQSTMSRLGRIDGIICLAAFACTEIVSLVGT